MIITAAVIWWLITFSNVAGLQCSQEPKDCDLCSNTTYDSTQHQLIFDSNHSIHIYNSFEIEFDIKLNEYCDSCTIMNIDNLISISINSIYEIDVFEISVSNISVNILLPIDDQFHHIYLSNSVLTNKSMYNQNIFIIDNFERYFGGSILPKNGPHQLYIGDVNASIKNICINSPIKTTDNIFKSDIHCGDTLFGEVRSMAQIYYYYFELFHTSDVIFDSCSSSSYHTYLELYTINYDKISATGKNHCYPGTQTVLQSLSKGRYIIEISSWQLEIGNHSREWRVEIGCFANRNDEGDEHIYYVLPELTMTGIEWFEAESICETLYGTTLATIMTDEDMKNAFNVINDNFNISTSVFVWTGLAQIGTHGSNWQWIDDSFCNYTTSDCIDDYHSHQNQPDNSPNTNRSAAALFITEHTNHNNLPTFIDVPMVYDHEYQSDHFSICNGPNSKYNIKNCSGNNCWRHSSYNHQFSDYQMESDLTRLSNPSIAYWNSTLFIVGTNEIHYTTMQPFDDNYVWHHHAYNDIVYWNDDYMYAQHESILYIYGIQFNPIYYNDKPVLLRIDLNTLQSTQEDIFGLESFHFITHCIAASEHSVYFIQTGRILIYHTEDNTWSVIDTGYTNTGSSAFIEQTTTTSCTITNDQNFIYIFDTYHIAKYEINNGTFSDLQSSYVCFTRDAPVSAVAARDGNIYLHGCYVSALKTIIFNTINDEFQNTTIGIQRPNKSRLPYYRSSKIVAVDNNILYLYTKTENGFLSSVAVTNNVSINFASTEKTEAVWPSDGFDIKYYINDFNSNLTHDYHVLFYSNDILNDPNHSVTLNTIEDHCTCDESFYKCYNCQQHFDLQTHLTLIDNIAEKLILRVRYIGGVQYSNPLILPRSLTIPLQRCIISITKPWITSIGVHSSIISQFSLSYNCMSRTNFSLNIQTVSVSNQFTHIYQQLIISIGVNHTITCKVCEEQFKLCVECHGNKFTIIQHISSIDSKFLITFKSNTIDLKLLPPSNYIIIYWNHAWKMDYLFILFIFFIIFCVIFIPIRYLIRRQKRCMDVFVVHKTLVLIIPIERFKEETMFLPGVRLSMINLENLWSGIYNYDVFICNKVNRECTKQDVIDFIDVHKKKLNYGKYQAVIVHVLSHGNGFTFKTSDLQDIQIDFLQQFLEKEAEGHDEFIALIFNHVYQMQYNYSMDPSVAIYENLKYIEYHSNCGNVVTIQANEPTPGSGVFAECICLSFDENSQRIVKADFNALVVEIARDFDNRRILLEKSENINAEMVFMNGFFRYPIRFEKTMKNKFHTAIELETLHKHNTSNPVLDNRGGNDVIQVIDLFDEQYNVDNSRNISSDLDEEESKNNDSTPFYDNQTAEPTKAIKYSDSFIQNEIQSFNKPIIQNLLALITKLVSLTNQLHSAKVSNNPNLIVQYGGGNEISKPSLSGEPKQNDKNGNNFNANRNYSNNNKHDEEDKKNNNNNNNNHSNSNHNDDEYGCNVPWHAERLKKLEAENRMLKLLLRNQMTTDEFESIPLSTDQTNTEEKKETEQETEKETEQDHIQSKETNGAINLKISNKLVKKEIPNKVKEVFCHALDYMNDYVHLYHKTVMKIFRHDKKCIKVINYDIQCKQTQKALFVVCEKTDPSNSNDTAWKTNHNLYTDSELEKKYKISPNNLPLPATINEETNTKIEKMMQQVADMLQNEKRRNLIICNKTTPWNNEDKIPIFNKSPNGPNGLIFILEKYQFVERLKIFADKNVKNIHLVPIVRFDKAGEYFYEVAWMVDIGNNINIGISFKYVNNKKTYWPSAIYLDIHDQHRLVANKHNCTCLAKFNCVINSLQIGQSKEKRIYQRCKSTMQQEMKKYMLIIDNLKVTVENLESDQQLLIQCQNDVNQQQQTCNQIYGNCLNALWMLTPQAISSPTFQIYNDQSSTQINNLYQNEDE